MLTDNFMRSTSIVKLTIFMIEITTNLSNLVRRCRLVENMDNIIDLGSTHFIGALEQETMYRLIRDMHFSIVSSLNICENLFPRSLSEETVMISSCLISQTLQAIFIDDI